MKNSTIQWMAPLAGLCFAGGALAVGTHAGGHGHDPEASAIGKPGLASKVNRTVTVLMNDSMRYSPSTIQVKRGETVRFIVINQGQIKHEMSLGTHQELLEHLELMKKFPEMEHEEPGKVTLDPGRKGQIIWQFTRAGEVHFACLMPGHYEGGMRGSIQVLNR